MTNESYHYQVIARAIAFIDESAPHQPSLEEVAAHVHLSAAHFQRLFSQWVGISPKRYQQYLALSQAKNMLRDRHSLLDTSLDMGFSSPSRLHDLFLTWEAMSPGEYAKSGKGLVIYWGEVASPFGTAVVYSTERGICGLGFSDEMGLEHSHEDMRNRWAEAEFVHNPTEIEPIANALFTSNSEVHLHLIGAPFQLKVWEALLQVPSGHVTTYGDIAAKIGNPKAVRAVGTAVGRNPISWLIPCHRALRKSGALGGYHWGLPIKRAMLAYESARLDAQ